MMALLAASVAIVLVLGGLHWPLWLAVPSLLVAYVMQSIYRPYARCIRCKGSPRYASNTGRTWRDCWWCGGSGKRTRWGRKWFDSAVKNRTG